MREVLSRIVSCEVAERAGVVAGALRGDAQAVAARVLDDRHDVVGALGEGDERGPLVVREVPRPAGLIPVRVGGADDEASDAVVGGGESGGGVEHGRDPRRGPDRRASGDSLSSFAMPATSTSSPSSAPRCRRHRRACSRSARRRRAGRRAGGRATTGRIDPASEVETVSPGGCTSSTRSRSTPRWPWSRCTTRAARRVARPPGSAAAARRGTVIDEIDFEGSTSGPRAGGSTTTTTTPATRPRWSPACAGTCTARAPERGAAALVEIGEPVRGAYLYAGTCPPTCATRRRR